MKEATPVAGKVIPPALNKRAVSNNKGPVQTTSLGMDCTPAYQDKSPPNKKKPPSAPCTSDLADVFEATTAGARKDVNMLLSKFAKVLNERAAADTAQMKELEGILTEAQNLESYLKEKKNHLRQTLALISDKLKG
ncbi:testis-expressed protein 12 [Lates calcarifer]|uniref:Testis-expressed protein 12 n=1 Tax=Lates calcarifer TaxID=8187 RepID=A0A4W6C5X1_LATCA|nr:testis-expressed protein 12 [Lates calcarifer]XP_018556366.1 testis-expressed protein 12 [Lates calcarifer]XP_018556370.1 testis-expressed protein 12 [Lates calcarifer]XP_050921697.1 testis-expressed protein 12 [Lates calcarifer]